MLNADQAKQKIVDDQTRELYKWQVRCVEQYESYDVSVSNPDPIRNETTNELFCAPLWDGLLCWPPSPASSMVALNCPAHVTGLISSNFAKKHCTENGTWFISDITNRHWTDYSNCVNGTETTILVKNSSQMHFNATDFEAKWVPVVKILSDTGYVLSFLTLVIAFLLMFFIKKLHCPRNILHMHLFASFIFRAFFSLLKDFLLVKGTGLVSDVNYDHGNASALYFHLNSKTNNWECKLLVALWQYFITSSYSWILMEGLYLHNLIFRALFVDSNKSILRYILLGWGMPFIVVVPWIIIRLKLDDSLCWTTYKDAFSYNVLNFILIAPIIVSISINFILFARISYVLYNKLRSPVSETNRRYLKWAKSTLILVPLFGVPYTLFIGMSYIENEIVQTVWIFCDQLFGSFQGFFVAVLYCFMNSEVKSEFKQQLEHFCDYVDDNRVLMYLLPCRKLGYLSTCCRSTVGRGSVCTTMSCTSLYANGVVGRNSKFKYDGTRNSASAPLEKCKEHCQSAKSFQDLSSRKNSKPQRRCSQCSYQRHSIAFNLPSSGAETSLCKDRRQEKSRSDPNIVEENIHMLV